MSRRKRKKTSSGGGTAPPTEPSPVLTIIQQIKTRELKGKDLDPDDRRRCVRHMTDEGYSIVQIAQIFGVNERTIARDRAVIRQENRFLPDPDFEAETIGDLTHQARFVIGRMLRLARSVTDAPAIELEALRTIWTVTRELVQCLQGLGYLPMATHPVKGELTHHIVEPLSPDELRGEIAELEIVLSKDGQRGEAFAKLMSIKREFSLFQLAEGVIEVRSSVVKIQNDAKSQS